MLKGDRANYGDKICQDVSRIRNSRDNYRDHEIIPDLVFKDPYSLDFMNLPSKYSESDLENAILNNIKEFLYKLDNNFCFVARQKENVY